MAALPQIDFARVVSSVDLRDLIGRDLGWAGAGGKYACPFHDERTPSLMVYETRFHCFGCGQGGDAIDWLVFRRGMSKIEAAKYLDPSLEIVHNRPRATVRPATGNPTAISRKPHQEPARAIPESVEANPTPPDPSEIWKTDDYQAKLEALVSGGVDRLWSSEGQTALDWLRDRGLTDDTIRRFRLGFFPANHVTRDPVEGLTGRDGKPSPLRAVRGVTIPWPAPGSCHRPGEPSPECPWFVGMNVRRLSNPVDAPLPDSDDKCRAVLKSRRGFLYPFPDLRPSREPAPILLVEGEFDALIGHQLVGQTLHVGTVGGASVNPRRLPVETLAALARCSTIFLAFDVDEAGSKAAWEWRQAYPHKSRRVLLPHGKDLTDFVVAGGDLPKWVASITGQPVPVNPVPTIPPPSLAPVIPRSDHWWKSVRALARNSVRGDAWEPPGLTGEVRFFDWLETSPVASTLS